MTKQRMAMRSNFPWSDFKKLGTPELSSSSSTRTALSPKNFEKRAHPISESNHGDVKSDYTEMDGIYLSTCDKSVCLKASKAISGCMHASVFKLFNTN